MKWLPELLLGLSPLLALVYMVRAANALRRQTSLTSIKWKKGCCVAGLVLALISWLCALGIVAMGELEGGDALVVPVFWLGLVVAPIALVMGLVTTTKPGYFLAKSAAALAFFWAILWMSLGRGV